MKIRCHTNLDLHHSETWIDELPCRPMVGDLITSSSGLELQVVRVSFKERVQQSFREQDDGANGIHRISTGGYREVIAETELHLPPHRYENISAFEKWYKNRNRY